MAKDPRQIPLREGSSLASGMDYRSHLPGAASYRTAEATRDAIRSLSTREATEATMRRHHDALHRLGRL